MSTGEPIRDVVIAGGGTAGWMVAAAAARFLNDGRRRVRLVESDAIGTVGVGESTIPPITLFNQMLGVSEADFVRATAATYKLGIEFVGWGAENERYFHGFGPIGRPLDGVSLYQLWLKHRGESGVGRLENYVLSAVAASNGRFLPPSDDQRSPLSLMMNAFHIDAGLYARFLRDYAERRGVERIEGRIAVVNRRGESGDVQALALDDGRTVAGDLFIDCTGFRSLLLGGGMGVAFRDWAHWLPCDRAIAVPTTGTAEPPPYTRATARSAGWQWRIPLQHRIGNGLVYSSTHLDDAAAERELLDALEGEPLAEPNRLRFRAGHRESFWQGNVVAIGLSAGFLEPLESTSIHLIQYGIQRLFELFPDRGFGAAERAEYNRLMRESFESIRDFVVLHYKATRRSGSFWDAVRTMPVPDTLATKIELFRSRARVIRYQDDLFEVSNWAQVMIGQGVLPAGHDPLADSIAPARAQAALGELRGAFQRTALTMPRHAEYLARLLGGRRPTAAVERR